MFSGIVEAMGTVLSVTHREGVREVRVVEPSLAPQLALGQSIAVDGACLTVVRSEGSSFAVEVVGSTLSRTIAGEYVPGRRVNLERALRMGDRLDGHLVQGHVDGVGTLVSARPQGEFQLLEVELPPDVARGTVLHGSIGLNGVSLTVNGLEGRQCQVAIIPYTWEHTNLSLLRPGDRVNVEGDLIGKYVARWLSTRGGPGVAGSGDGRDDHAL